MNTVVIDLEFNQGFDTIKSDKKCPFEIIQIGAIVLNQKFEKIGSFNRLIKPQIYKELNPYIGSLTGLTINNLIDQEPFIKVLQTFLEYIEKDVTFCTWGMADMKELFRNAEYYRFPISRIPKSYINLQPFVSKYLNFPKHISVSLSDAINFLNIEHNNHFHDAYYDAVYTAKIFQKIYEPSIPIQLYNPTPPLRLPRPKKQYVNLPELISQFEKMYQRDMTIEEKDIIKLAYFMGKTGQFIE